MEEPPLLLLFPLPPPSKRLENITSDRLSDLPDSLLLHILSFLPMEDVVTTCILSKRWQFLWTSVSTLVFHNDSRIEEDITEFVASAYKTLAMWRGGNIKKFAVSFNYYDLWRRRSPSDVDLLIRFAVQNNVEDLDLRLDPSIYCEHRYKLPRHIYTNSSLTRLSLANCDVVPSVIINWSSLKSLSLQDVTLSEDVIAKILCGCPSLQVLKLFSFLGIDRLDINSASLKFLVIEHAPDDIIDFPCWLEISAPNLLSLQILGPATGRRFRLIDVSSLVNAKLDFIDDSAGECLYDDDDDDEEDDDDRRDIFLYEEPNHLSQLLESLRHVKEITLGNWCIQVLSILEVKGLPYLPYRLSSCKCLTLDTHVNKSDIPGIASLLQSSPNLETLVLNMASLYDTDQFSNLKSYNFDGENYWTSQMKISKCLSMHLRTIKIVGFMGGGGDKSILALVQFLLGNARVLEKMIVSLRLHHGMDSKWCMSRELLKLAQKLLSFPRSSPHAVIMFSEMT